MTSSTDERTVIRAPAKINLTLAVKGRRNDGYHELESWVVCIDWADELCIEPAESFALKIENAPQIPDDERNLVYCAAHLLAERSGRRPDINIRLVKRIPVGAGLGGGSADAAACLVALNRLWRLNRSQAELAELAAEVGSDVPLFIYGGQLVMRGRGECVERLDRRVAGWVALICPRLSASTSEVYAAHALAGQDRVESKPWTTTDRTNDRLMALLFNDLEAAAFVVEPALKTLHARIDGLGGRPVRVTGSGSAMFTLFDEETAADAWAARVREVTTEATVMVYRILTDSENARI